MRYYGTEHRLAKELGMRTEILFKATAALFAALLVLLAPSAWAAVSVEAEDVECLPIEDNGVNLRFPGLTGGTCTSRVVEL